MTELTLNLNDEILSLIESKGYTPTQFFKKFFDYLLEVKTLPFEDDEYFEPNEETKKAIMEGRAEFEAGKLKRYSNVEDMMKDVLALAGTEK